MTEDLLTRARELAVYIIETRTTIRQAAKHFGLSKSTVHKDLAERLPACRWRTARCIFLCGRFSTRTGPSAISAAVWLRERNIRGSESCRFPGVFPFFGGNVRLFIQLAKNL